MAGGVVRHVGAYLQRLLPGEYPAADLALDVARRVRSQIPEVMNGVRPRSASTPRVTEVVAAAAEARLWIVTVLLGRGTSCVRRHQVGRVGSEVQEPQGQLMLLLWSDASPQPWGRCLLL